MVWLFFKTHWPYIWMMFGVFHFIIYYFGRLNYEDIGATAVK